jgi:hypothetical protein
MLYEPQINPVLLCDSTNVLRPPSTATSSQPVAPPSRPPLGLMVSKAQKTREEFSTKHLEHLLHAVIDVNPYMAPCSKVGDQWKAVAKMVQDKGLCWNQEAETLKNKVTSLLAWVELTHILYSMIVQELTDMPLEGGNKTSPHSPLGRELGHDPLAFASLSGKLDAIQHLKREVKETCDEERDQTKEVCKYSSRHSIYIL